MQRLIYASKADEVSTFDEEVLNVLKKHGWHIDRCTLQNVENAIIQASIAQEDLHGCVLVEKPSLIWPPEINLAIDRIRRLEEKFTLGGGEIKARTLPILGVVSQSPALLRLQESTKHHKWLSIMALSDNMAHALYEGPGSKNGERVCEALEEVVQSWNKALINELECIGQAVTIDDAGLYHVSYAFNRKRDEGEILHAFSVLKGLIRSNYLILANDLLDQYSALQNLIWLIENYREIAKIARMQNENLFQLYFQHHPQMLNRDEFRKAYCKVNLPRANGSKPYQPDFVQEPRRYANIGNRWCVTDLKLPHAPVLEKQERFHQTLTHNMVRAIQQLKNYQKAFNDPDAAAKIAQQIGRAPKNPSLAVVIGYGLDQEKHNRLEEVRQAMCPDVKIITYDQICAEEGRCLKLNLRLMPTAR